MIIDGELILGEKVAITSAAVTLPNVVKTGAGDAIVNPFLYIKTDGTAFAGGTSLAITLQYSADEAFTAPVSKGVYTFTLAQLTADTPILTLRLPYGGLGYVRITATPSGTFTAGTISAYIVKQTDLDNIN
jgi:hypothetical protein